MEMLRLKILAGIEPEDARLTRFERNALQAMPADEVFALAMRSTVGE
jgi:hypothetical protein